MARSTTPEIALSDMVDDWATSLRAARKSPKTIRGYTESATALVEFLRATGRPTTLAELRRGDVEAFLVSLDEAGNAPSTTATRYRCCRVFLGWCEEQEGVPSVMAKMRPPAVPTIHRPVLTPDEQDRLLKACKGDAFEDRRDLALILVLMRCGLRRAEAAGLRVADYRKSERVMTLTGKGSKLRTFHVPNVVSEALNRYLRARGGHADSRSPMMFLGVRGPLTDSGVAQVVRRRGNAAGIAGLRPHVLRHTAVDIDKRSGASDEAVMVKYGWSSPQMLHHYAASRREQRAVDELREIDDRG